MGYMPDSSFARAASGYALSKSITNFKGGRRAHAECSGRKRHSISPSPPAPFLLSVSRRTTQVLASMGLCRQACDALSQSDLTIASYRDVTFLSKSTSAIDAVLSNFSLSQSKVNGIVFILSHVDCFVLRGERGHNIISLSRRHE